MNWKYRFKDKFHIDPIVTKDLLIYESDNWGSNNFSARLIKKDQIKFYLRSAKANPQELVQAIVKDKKFKVLFVVEEDYLLLKWQPSDILFLEALVKILERAGKVWDLKVDLDI